MYNLDSNIEKVVSEKTKEYLKEVISTYYNGNYRSSIISLYAAVNFDFMEKIKMICDFYKDDKLEKFLKEINEKINNGDTKYSEIEKDIFEQIKKIELLSSIELDYCDQLKTNRDCCAHPVFYDDGVLYNPSKEQALYHISNMFRYVFLKHPIDNKELVGIFMKNVDEHLKNFGTQNLERNLKSLFFTKISDLSKKNLFNMIWGCTFISNSDNNIARREGLYVSLQSLLKENKQLLLEDFEKRMDEYFLNINYTFNIYINTKELEFNKNGLLYLLKFLSENEIFYYKLPLHVKNNIDMLYEKNINLKLIKPLQDEQLEKRLNNFILKIGRDFKYNEGLNSEIFMLLYKKHFEYNTNTLVKFAIDYTLNNSIWSFDHIINIYREILINIIDEINKEQFKYLISIIDGTHMKTNHLKEKIVELCRKFNFTNKEDLKDCDINQNALNMILNILSGE